MTTTIKTSPFLQDLDRVSRVRSELADCLDNVANLLECSEQEGDRYSGRLELESEIESVRQATRNLRTGVFRLLVLGDMKRGKSTFLNALIGEKLLPSDVNPCTALLTVLRYGSHKQVTLHYKDDRPPQHIDIETFKREYTLDPDEAKQLEAEGKIAFPEISYAEIEYPLPLLEKGIEIIDSPGLNDTELRNQLSLDYINTCQAVLFVFRAVQPCTLEERRYLENYIKDRGLTTFFLINAWDEIRESAIDPNDPEEVEEAEDRLRQVFRTNLADYTRIEGRDRYDDRVFEISALDALRRQLQSPNAPLNGTGLPEFMAALDRFLSRDRAIAELRQATVLSQQTYHRVREAIARRMPLLGQDIEELKRRIDSVEPQFEELANIRDRFSEEIAAERDRQASEIAASYRNYILNLGDTFETDFVRYQPELGFIDAWQAGKREKFQAEFKRAFERYINEKLAEWERHAQDNLSDAFIRLARRAAEHGNRYVEVTDTMSEKLSGQSLSFHADINTEQPSPGWASWAIGFVSLASGNIGGVALAGAGFDWQNVLVNWFAVLGIGSFLVLISAGWLASIGLFGIPLLGLGVSAWQVERARKELMRVTRKEFVKSLPQLAQQHSPIIEDAVKSCFDAYEREVTRRIDRDIQSRRAELDNLVAQKESRQIDRDRELNRLQTLEGQVLAEKQKIESLYEASQFVSA
jgi:GTPase SAR1 family protein